MPNIHRIIGEQLEIIPPDDPYTKKVWKSQEKGMFRSGRIMVLTRHDEERDYYPFRIVTFQAGLSPVYSKYWLQWHQYRQLIKYKVFKFSLFKAKLEKK